MKLHEVGQFYGERNGWRMFDARFLTEKVKFYLEEEEDFVEHVMQAGYNQLIEIGCGYGRYLDWSLSREYSYLGLDIVPWLVELGQLRTTRAQELFQGKNCSIILHPAERLHDLVRRIKSEDSTLRPLVLFPFNIFGNLPSLVTALESLQKAEVDLVVSTFKTDAISTGFRLEYYKKCGYMNLNTRLLRQGLLIVSDEGFNAMAYKKDWLVDSFQKYGFSLITEHAETKVGNILYFRHGVEDAALVSNLHGPDSSTLTRVKAIIHIIETPRVKAGENPANANLLELAEFELELTCIGPNILSGIVPVDLKPGTIVHFNLALPFNTKETREIDLTGSVQDSFSAKGQFETRFKMTRDGELTRLGIRAASR